MIADAQELIQVHQIVAGTGAKVVRWAVEEGWLKLRAIGASFSAEANLSAKDMPELCVGTPTALVSSWLKGIEGEVEITFEASDRVLRFEAGHSNIEVGVITHSEDLIRANNLNLERANITVLGMGGDIWNAAEAVAWASAVGVVSNVDPRFEAVHCSYGKVWATDRSQGAWVDMDLPNEALPMIPPGLSAMAAFIDMDRAVIGVDAHNRLRVFSPVAELVAPLFAGDPFGDFMDHERIRETKAKGEVVIFTTKAMIEGLRRLDRVDQDDLAKRANVKGRVELSSGGDGQMRLSVLVDKRRATETIDCDSGSFTTIVPLGRFRALLKFLGAEETVMMLNGNGPITFDEDNRHAMQLPIVGRL